MTKEERRALASRLRMGEDHYFDAFDGNTIRPFMAEAVPGTNTYQVSVLGWMSSFQQRRNATGWEVEWEDGVLVQWPPGKAVSDVVLAYLEREDGE